ncbi:MAG: VCBS repeat-containing protein [Gemmatimonadetes bacterium]|nr:VCBS repeat-containing protein [Gemmatimonadota bacterium]
MSSCPSNSISSSWTTRGFEAFRQGTFGNGGQNLYVSRAGVLQRIHQFDLDRDGHVDLVFCNSQNHGEKPPVTVYHDVLGHSTARFLPSDGGRTGVVADLNGDGYDDLVVGMFYNGIRRDLNAYLYYGGPDGLGERRVQYLPAPYCTSVAAGDFDGDGKPDLAFVSDGKLRLFYQTALGFELKGYRDLDVAADQVASDDLDGDGYVDLAVRDAGGSVRILWGGPDGIEPGGSSLIPVDTDPSEEPDPDLGSYPEDVDPAVPLVSVLRIHDTPHVFVARSDGIYLAPFHAGREAGEPVRLSCRNALAIAVGDLAGDGRCGLVVACRDRHGGEECSWLYHDGNEGGYNDQNRTAIPSRYACDAAVRDLDGDGRSEIVICQTHTPESYTSESLAYRWGRDGLAPPRVLETHDARRVLLARASDDPLPQAVFINQFSRNLRGDIPVFIYHGGPDGFRPERRQEVPGWGAVEVLRCDLNDDGLPDLILANASENSVRQDPGSFVYYNGEGRFGSEPDVRLPTVRAHGVCCADLDRDGYLDLVFCGFDNPDIVIFYGGQDGFDNGRTERIRLEYEGVVYKDPRWIFLVDLNGDGWLDLVVPQIADDYSFILLGGPKGFSMDRCQALSVWHGACARAADLSGNGYPDLVIGGHEPSIGAPHDSFVHIYWNGPDGLREDRRTLLPSNAVNAMSIMDFNGDGLLDLFVCSYHDNRVRDIDSYIYWNRAGRGFSAADRTRLFTHSASGCVAADFDGDGHVDLAIAYHKVEGDHVGHSAVWWNGPGGFDARRVTRLPTTGPHGMTAVQTGNMLDAGPEEYYVSAPHEIPRGQAVTGIDWEAECGPGTWVHAQVRWADSEEALARSAWLGAGGAGTWYETPQPVRATGAGPWVQYRLALGARNGGSTPRVTEVRLETG